MAKLAANVFVAGAWYGPSYGSTTLPADVAEQVTNPAAFAPEPETAQEKAKSRPRSSSGGE